MRSSSYTKGRQSELVAQACRVLGKLDMTHGSLGHVSLRLDDSETLLIKGKGEDESALRFTEPSDIVEVDFNADTVDGPKGLRSPRKSKFAVWSHVNKPSEEAITSESRWVKRASRTASSRNSST